MSPGDFASMFVVMIAAVLGCSFPRTESQTASVEFEITEVQYQGWTGKSQVRLLIPRTDKPPDMRSLKQEALSMSQMHAGLGSSTNFIIAYLAPEAADGGQVNRDAELKNLPRPRFWRDEYRKWSGSRCNVMVEVTLESSGKVSNVELLGAVDRQCSKIPDVVEAARNIEFSPALRGGLPVTQKQMFLYRVH